MSFIFTSLVPNGRNGSGVEGEDSLSVLSAAMSRPGTGSGPGASVSRNLFVGNVSYTLSASRAHPYCVHRLLRQSVWPADTPRLGKRVGDHGAWAALYAPASPHSGYGGCLFRRSGNVRYAWRYWLGTVPVRGSSSRRVPWDRLFDCCYGLVVFDKVGS